MYKSMKPKERRDYYFENYLWLPKDVPLCINCEHFYQHYTLVHKYWNKLDCGHCVYPRVKGRKTYDTCEYFVQRGANT